MSEAMKINRRDFIKTAAVAGGGLLVGFHLPSGNRFAVAATSSETEINAWIHIGADDTITIRASQTELGQGPLNGNLMMLAEELECDWSKVTYELASGRKEYTNPLLGLQLTGGSTSTPGFWDVMRIAGAQTRHMLVSAAAKHWGVKAEDCVARDSVVTHKGKSLTYGRLAAAAAKEIPPKEPKLKSPDQFRLIGTWTARLDNEVKVTGKAMYGTDVQVPGMVVGAIRHAPFGGKIAGYDAAAAKAVAGVHDVLEVGQAIFPENSVPCLIVTADTYWQAEQGMIAANPIFDFGKWGNLNSEQISKTLHQGTSERGKLGRADGNVDKALTAAAKVVDAVYEVPYVSHSPLEPMNCTADFRGDFLEIWAPTQDPGAGYIVAAMLSGLPQDKIHINVTFTGGGFGRRTEVDYLEQAVEASMKLKKPVKLMWSREEDMQHNFNRPTYVAKMSAGLDANNNPTAWRHKIVGPGIWLSPYRSSRLKNLFAGSDFMKGMQESGVDFHIVQGGKEIGYNFANLEVEVVEKDFPVPIVFFRGVGNTQNAFFVECFIDEIANAAGRDPVELRRKLLAKNARMLGVLNLAAEKSGWGTPLPKGRYRGIAFHNSFDSPLADVIEISVRGRKRIKVHRVVRAVDCGLVVNPNGLDSQFQSGLVWGLTHAMYSEHTVHNDVLVQSNFHDYRLLNISQMPKFEVHTVPSKNKPTGIGEPVFHTVTPALCNAVFAATGRRIRSLPLRNHGFSLA